jgi:chaperonin GroES
MFTQIKPIGDRVLIEPAKQKETTESGKIFLPQSARDDAAHFEGVVAAVGSKVEDLKAGDIVLFEKTGTQVGDYWLVTPKEVIAIIA